MKYWLVGLLVNVKRFVKVSVRGLWCIRLNISYMCICMCVVFDKNNEKLFGSSLGNREGVLVVVEFFGV